MIQIKLRNYQKQMLKAFLALLIIVLGVYFLQSHKMSSGTSSSQMASMTLAESIGAEKQDTVAFAGVDDSLIAILKPVAVKKKKNAPRTWILQNGISMPVYILRITQLMDRHQCQILTSKEDSKSESVFLEYRCPHAKVASFQLDIGEIYSNNASQISFIFSVDSLGLNLIPKLKELNVKASLLVQSHRFSDSDLNLLNTSGLDIWLSTPMEPENYPYVKASADSLSLLIDGEKQWASILDASLKKIPQAKGFMPLKGQRAWVNQSMIEFVWSYAQKKSMSWLNPFHRLRGMTETHPCFKEDNSCLSVRDFREDMSVDEQITNAMTQARRVGQSIQVLPLNKSNLKALSEIQETVASQGSQWISTAELVIQRKK